MEASDKRILDQIRSEARLVIGFVEGIEYDTLMRGITKWLSIV